jgi:hypothetical protein
MRLFTSIATVVLWLPATPAGAAEFFVTPTGKATGTGTASKPWDLRTALAHPAAVKPGDTIWVRGGTYNGEFSSKLRGTADKPIIVRRYLAERAIVQGPATGNTTLVVEGVNTWFWGLEFTSPPGLRYITEPPLTRGTAIATSQVTGSGVGTKFINLLVHDGMIGIGLWKEALNSEIYGCVVYHNGMDDPVRGHGHGIYSQNNTGTMTVSDNIVFNQFAYGIHIYGSSAAFLDNFIVTGNILFNNGVLSKKSGPASNILLGGGRVCKNPLVERNYTYYSSTVCCGANDIPYDKGCTGARIVNNYFAALGQLALRWFNSPDAVITGNTFYGGMEGAAARNFSDNTVSSEPSTTAVFVRLNKYEARRGHIVAYNWEKKPSIPINLSQLGYSSGQGYTIRNVQDYYGTSISGVYSGAAMNIPMTSWTVIAPVGTTAPPSTFPEFGVFVVEPK